MSYAIRWTTPLNRTERRWLRCWLDRMPTSHPNLVERRRGGLTVRGATPDVAHSFAALTMAIIGRSRFAYTLAQLAEQADARMAA